MKQAVNGVAEDGRRIVPYFEHETDPEFFDGWQEQRATEHLDEIADMGFTNVVLCVTETDIATPRRWSFLRDTVAEMKLRDLEVWVDPWRVGSVFGGEAVSHFENSGEVSCRHNPRLNDLVKVWLDQAAGLEPDAVFWDEPEMKCDEHHNSKLDFIADCTGWAGRLALPSVVVLCANEKKKGHLEAVATMEGVREIGVDPYYPNAFTPDAGRAPDGRRDPEASRAYVAGWTRRVRQVAGKYGTRSHVWLQLFDVPPDDLAMPLDFAEAIWSERVDSIGMWGFRACASVPQFASKYSQEHLRAAWEIAGEIAGRDNGTPRAA
jgi:hypothetical protein